MNEATYNESSRILAEGHRVANDTRITRLNNNDLIIGPSGAGKTSGYVLPNILNSAESMVVTDTKGSLLHEVGPALRARGYHVINLDFARLTGSVGYNPLDFVRIDERTGAVNEKDIGTIATSLAPLEDKTQPFWELAARMFMGSLVAYVMEALPAEERTLSSVLRVSEELTSGAYDTLIDELAVEQPQSIAVRKYRSFAQTKDADKMFASICGIVAEKLDTLGGADVKALACHPQRIDFTQLGCRKTALFLTVSDTDRSMDRLVGLFYTQAFQQLIRYADEKCPHFHLPVPVRFYLDDFATNCTIADFDNLMSVIRSRGVSASVIVQSLSQLDALYGTAKASTIANNCDHWLYLGGQDAPTAQRISQRVGKTVDSVLNMPIGQAYLLERGVRAQAVEPVSPAAAHALKHSAAAAAHHTDEQHPQQLRLSMRSAAQHSTRHRAHRPDRTERPSDGNDTMMPNEAQKEALPWE